MQGVRDFVSVWPVTISPFLNLLSSFSPDFNLFLLLMLPSLLLVLLLDENFFGILVIILCVSGKRVRNEVGKWPKLTA